MAEYIEREALFKAFERVCWFDNADRDEIAEELLLQMPTADVVEVVRCKECKHHNWEQEPCHGKTEHFCSVLNAQVFADFYCYHGAKMDGKGEGE